MRKRRGAVPVGAALDVIHGGGLRGGRVSQMTGDGVGG